MVGQRQERIASRQGQSLISRLLSAVEGTVRRRDHRGDLCSGHEFPVLGDFQIREERNGIDFDARRTARGWNLETPR